METMGESKKRLAVDEEVKRRKRGDLELNSVTALNIKHNSVRFLPKRETLSMYTERQAF